MWIPALWIAALSPALLASTRELTAYRKAMLQPFIEQRTAPQRGYNAPEAGQKDSISQAVGDAAGRIDGVKSPNSGNGTDAIKSRLITYEEFPSTVESKDSTRKDGIKYRSASSTLHRSHHEGAGQSNMQHPDSSSAANVNKLYGSMVPRASFGMIGAQTATSKTPSLLSSYSITNPTKAQLGSMKPYCSIVPCRNVFKILGNLLASMRLTMLDKNVTSNANPLMMVVMASASGLPFYALQFAKSKTIMDFLRKRWAFQGECGDFSVEYVLNSMLNVLLFESGLKLALRLWFYAKGMNMARYIPEFVTTVARGLSSLTAFVPQGVNLIGSGIFGGYWNSETRNALAHMFVQSVVFGRLVLFTAAQHAFFQENYDTAAFMINPTVSQIASAFSGLIFALASTSNIGTMLMLKNFSNLADVEHLLDSSGFRSTETQAAATSYARNALHNVPKLLKPTSLDILVKLTYYHDYISRLVPSGIEWPVLLLHITMALNSNSAAGLYLSLVNLIYAVINQRLSSYERSLLTQDIQEIVQESR